MKIAVFWFRRDLRFDDNHGLMMALKSGLPVVPLFIFDENILRELPKNDARVSFISEQLLKLDKKLRNSGSSLLIRYGQPFEIWQQLISRFEIASVFVNHDYEPYSLGRDSQVARLLRENGIDFQTFKDQVIFEKNEVLKSDGSPYTIFTPYKNKWLEKFQPEKNAQSYKTSELTGNFAKINFEPFTLEQIGFTKSAVKTADFQQENIDSYHLYRDLTWMDHTTHAGPHLRFGTISVRRLALLAFRTNQVFLNELIWREFFMMILYHFPQVVHHSFKPRYDEINWLNDEVLFEKWKNGNTGYPLVDAGMRQLNQTGFMHNRVRMVTASFLCKHLLIDWRWGEAYFAEKLLDFELSSNNGNWQWAAGTGCDAAPYFRVFNPVTQQQKFDPQLKYINRWIDDFNEINYPEPVVEHSFARERAIQTYKSALAAY